MTWRGSLVAALLATLVQPRWWLLALAGFLIRGGVLIVLLPIIAPPTVAGLMSFLAPTVLGQIISGGPGAPIAIIAIATALVVTAFLSIAAWLGTWFDATLIGEAATDMGEAGADDDLASAAKPGAEAGPSPDDRPAGLGTARLGPHVLTGVAFVFAAARIFSVAYREATTPGAPTIPFVVRVIQGAPEAVVALVVAWVLAEAVGGLALRDLLRRASGDGDGPPPVRWAIVHGIRDLATPRGLATLLVVDLGVIVVALPGWLATQHAWDQLRILLSGGAAAIDLAIGLGLFVGVAFGGALLLAVALAWRSTAWTLAFARPDRHAAVAQDVGGVTLGAE
jgi:hypothetical protein